MIKHIPPPLGSDANSGFVSRILIVDDDEAHLDFIKAVILKERFNCWLTLCSGAREALEFVRHNPLDLMLLDVMMPEMNGLEMIRRMKQDPQTALVPVIFLTSSQETDAILQAYEAGATDFIAKPVNSAVLAARMQAILQRVGLENELKLRNQELLQINRIKDELLSVCSHDLRAPLAAIEVICQRLGADMAETAEPDCKIQLGKIVTQSRLARRLVENLLDYHKIEEGMLVPSPSFFGVRDFLTICAEQEQPQIQNKGLTLRSKLPDEDLVAFGDRDLLAQAVRNILGNAVKFACKNISLTARLEASEDDADGGSRLIISITDDGPGIDPDRSGQIFQKYTKADPNDSGSGLGLYIASKAVEAHAGSLTVASDPGRDTIFTIALPHAYSRDQLPDLSTVSEARGLILSASKCSVGLLEGVLTEAGMLDVNVCTDDLACLDMLELQTPEFVVIDLENPACSTFNLVKLINRAGLGVHLIFYGSAFQIEEFSKYVNIPFIPLASPLEPMELLRLIGDLLLKKSGEEKTVSVKSR